MIVYNVTVSVEESITKNWLNWMKNKHIPEILSTGYFIKAQINQVITNDDINNTFAIAYSCENLKDLHQYQIKFSEKLQKKHLKKYGDKAIAFRTIMHVIKQF